MMHPELRYDMARLDHQGRIQAAARSREARAARREQRGTGWLASLATRLRRAHRVSSRTAGALGATAGATLVTGPVGKALAV